MKRLFILLSLWTALAPNARAQGSDGDFLKEYPLAFRLGLGASMNPGKFLLVGDGEYRFDRFFALGTAPAFGGRFILPIRPSRRVEASIQSGIGWIYLADGAFSSTHFLYEVGPNVDVYILPHLTVGVGYIVDITSANSRAVLHSLYGAVGYRF
jgi:hypothetical protein